MLRPAVRVVVAAALAAAVAGCADEPPPRPGAVSPGPSAGSPEHRLWATALPEAVPKRDFVLTDQSGSPFRFVRETRDAEVTLLYFGYTHCADICPTTMVTASYAVRDLPSDVAQEVRVVFVTVDPARDDVERLREWVGLFNRDFVGLTGSRADVDAVLRLFGYEPAGRADLGGGRYTVGHPAEVLVFTDDGFAHAAFPYDLSAPRWQQDLITLVREGWSG